MQKSTINKTYPLSLLNFAQLDLENNTQKNYYLLLCHSKPGKMQEDNKN